MTMAASVVRLNCCALALLVLAPTAVADPQLPDKLQAARTLTGYFEAMSVPQPFQILAGEALATHQSDLRARLLADVGLDPLPERIDLDVHRSRPIDHPWCVIEMVEYQMWPGIYGQALLLTPKDLPEKPVPAILCPHGHWNDGFAWPDVQKRLLVLAKMGYVVLSPRQNHLEQLTLGLSHQTLMIWANMRGIDLLQSLPEVDPERIGAAGASGGGLQTQMIAALDPRVKAATIVGMTCDFREILAPHAAHCGCNHWPNAMVHADAPEISALAFPRSVQYLAMNDWTRAFPYDNFPTIQEQYRIAGVPSHVSCTYWPTQHLYDREKRERTYWWMERWLRHQGSYQTAIPSEPEEVVTVFPPEILNTWPVENPANRGITALKGLFHQQFHHSHLSPPEPTEWASAARNMQAALPELLGLDNAMERNRDDVVIVESHTSGAVTVTTALLPGESDFSWPAIIVAPSDATSGPWPVTLCLNRDGATGLVDLKPFIDRAAAGRVVVVVDIRFSGTYDLERLAGLMGPELLTHKMVSELPSYREAEDQRKYLLWAWERNSVVWGRPLVGMAVSDIQHVLDALRQDPRANLEEIHLETRDSALLGLAACFAAILDARIQSLDVDLTGSRYDHDRSWNEAPTGLPVIPFILRQGDVPQWLAVLCHRQLTVHKLAITEQETQWLKSIFAAQSNSDGLRIVPNE